MIKEMIKENLDFVFSLILTQFIFNNITTLAIIINILEFRYKQHLLCY